MSTTKEMIRSWLNEAKSAGATHMLVVCDDFDHTDYPVRIMPGENPRERASNLGSMQRLMECYALHVDLEFQLNEFRSHHYEMLSSPAPAPKKTSEVTGPKLKPGDVVIEWDRYDRGRESKHRIVSESRTHWTLDDDTKMPKKPTSDDPNVRKFFAAGGFSRTIYLTREALDSAQWLDRNRQKIATAISDSNDVKKLKEIALMLGVSTDKVTRRS